VAQSGMGLKFDEEKARQELEKETVIITLDLHAGNSRATAWGCDLSYDYVRINADYRS
jgi:glutamate N-acetyltransferase/amino-acid N-acetyltransferase